MAGELERRTETPDKVIEEDDDDEHDEEEQPHKRRQIDGGSLGEGGPGSVTGGGSDSIKRRRRRIFSCESCQRRKCKCFFDAELRSCRQCHTLRVECSLRESVQPTAPARDVGAATAAMQEKLQRHEEAIAELRGRIDLLTQQNVTPHGRPDAQRIRFSSPGPALEPPPNPEDLSNPADESTSSAPIVVLREIGSKTMGSQRRTVSRKGTDLVSLRIIDEATAGELIQLFLRWHSMSRILLDMDISLSSRQLRTAYPFLHNTCCVHGLVHHQELFCTMVHRQVYENVRSMLGQALLASPLAMDEIYAILLMSDGATDPAKDESEYIDSWLLTGYCAQQAMLGINFAKIVANIKDGKATTADQRAIRLWSTICLSHLRWSVTTGRPPVIRNAYINHCSILVSFYDASSQDGMMLAEVVLWQHLCGNNKTQNGREGDDFSEWRAKWNHLLQLPTASNLWLSYYTASLVAVVRLLEQRGENLAPSAFLAAAASELDGDGGINNNNISGVSGGSNGGGNKGSNGSASTDTPSVAAIKMQLRRDACQFATSVVEQFLRLQEAHKHILSLNDWLCLGYGVLIVGHYGQQYGPGPGSGSSSGPDTNNSPDLEDLVDRLDDWCKRTPSRSWLVLARSVKITRSRLRARREHRDAAARHRLAGGGLSMGHRVVSTAESSGPDLASHLSMIPNPLPPLQQQQQHPREVFSMALPMAFSENSNSEAYSNMNNFFSGGFLDFSNKDANFM